MKKFLLSAGVMCVLSMPAAWADAEAMKVVSVSDYSFTLNEQQAVSVIFGASDYNYCSLTVLRQSVSDSFKFSSTQRSDKDASISCTWDKKHFVQSSKHPTGLNIEILSLDKEAKKAEVSVSLKLVEPSSDEYFELNDARLLITDQGFEHLIEDNPS